MKTVLAALVALFIATTAHASSDRLKWSQLIDPQAQVFDDPFKDVPYAQLQDLAAVMRLELRIEQHTASALEKRELEAELLAKRESLKQAGMNTDELLQQRWAVAENRQNAANAGNSALDGEVVKISGFAIPAPPDADGTPIAYLVPERGMCSHTPPPNANQMVRVRLKEELLSDGLHTPVVITGELAIEPSEHVLFLVDGLVPMRATFALETKHIQVMKPFSRIPEGPDMNSEWAQELMKKLNAVAETPMQ